MRNALLKFAAALAVPTMSFAGAVPAHAETSAALTIDSPLEELMANPKTRTVIEKELPGLDKHPMYERFKAMSLVRLQPLSSGQISEEKVAAVKEALAKVNSGK